MKRQLIALIFLAVSAFNATAEDAIQYSKPFVGLEAGPVSSVIIRMKDESEGITISDIDRVSR